MQRLEVSGAVRHIYVIGRQGVKLVIETSLYYDARSEKRQIVGILYVVAIIFVELLVHKY
jgi:hypothetical protein